MAILNQISYAQNSDSLEKFLGGQAVEISSGIENVRTYLFANYTENITVSLPDATVVAASGFNGSTGLKYIRLEKVATLNGNVFSGCTNLAVADFDVCGNIRNNAFAYCSALTSLILRADAVASLQSAVVFFDSAVSSGTACIYVPENLVNSYKSASYWTAYASQIKPFYVAETAEERESALTDDGIPDGSLVIFDGGDWNAVTNTGTRYTVKGETI